MQFSWPIMLSAIGGLVVVSVLVVWGVRLLARKDRDDEAVGHAAARRPWRPPPRPPGRPPRRHPPPGPRRPPAGRRAGPTAPRPARPAPGALPGPPGGGRARTVCNRNRPLLTSRLCG